MHLFYICLDKNLNQKPGTFVFKLKTKQDETCITSLFDDDYLFMHTSQRAGKDTGTESNEYPDASHRAFRGED